MVIPNTEDEIEKLLKFEGDIDKDLHKEEKFLVTLCKFPRLK